MWISRYFIWFILFSFGGWVFETIYCTAVTKKWQNRGFLFGPICPIYGIGGAGISIFMDNLSKEAVENMRWFHIFLIMFFGSMVLEYVTHWLLETLFHMTWWDYSNMPINVNGRICLPASILFGIAGDLSVYVLWPAMEDLTGWMAPILIEAVALLLMAAAAADTALTVSALTSFLRSLEHMEQSVDARMELFVQSVVDRAEDVREDVKLVPKSPLPSPAEVIDRLPKNIAPKVDMPHLPVEDLREKLTASSMQETAERMGRIRRDALKRVENFRPRSEFDRTHMALAAEVVRGYVKKLPRPHIAGRPEENTAGPAEDRTEEPGRNR